MEWKMIQPELWKPENNGDEIIGKLITKDPSKFIGRTNYHLEVTKEGKLSQVTVFGSTVLDDKMQYINLGQIIKIVYKGKQKNKKGQDTNIYEVYRGN